MHDGTHAAPDVCGPSRTPLPPEHKRPARTARYGQSADSSQRPGACMRRQGALHTERSAVRQSLQPSIETDRRGTGEYRSAYFIVLRYATTSARSFSFLKPGKAMFVPLMYFFGFCR